MFVVGLFLFSSLYSQTSTVLPLTAKSGIKNISFSINDRYAMLYNEIGPSQEVSVVIYDLTSRKPIKSKLIKTEEPIEPFYISNDSRYILLHKSNGYDIIHNTVTDENIEDNRKTQLSHIVFGDQEALEVFFPEDYLERAFFDYWFSRKFIASVENDKLFIRDTLGFEKKINMNNLPGLKNYDKNELSISQSASWLAYNAGSKIYVYDLIKNELVLQDKIGIKVIDDISIDDNGEVCIAGYFEKEKSMGLHWYNPKVGKYIAHSTQDELNNLSYVSQFHHFVTLGLGTVTKKRVENTRYVNLSTGIVSDNYIGKGWTSFNEVQKYIKDTLSKKLLSAEEFEYVNSSRVYYNYWQMIDDYLDEDGNYNPKTENPQVSAEFFKFIDQKGWNIEVYTAHENKVTFQNTTGDLGFFGLSFEKKLLYFWNGNKKDNNERVVKLLITRNNRPIFFSNDNYYFCPEGVPEVLGFEQDLKYYSAEQFDLKYNRPDIILDRLGYADSSLIAAYHAAYKKRLKKMGFTEDMLEDDFHLPKIEIKNFEEMPTLIESDKIDLNLHLEDSKYNLDRINVWVNDVAIYGTDGISLRNLETQKLNKTISVDLAKGNNKVQVSVLNQAGAESFKETFEVECTVGKKKANLYLITIGESKFEQSDFNLTYAAKDAKDIAALLPKSKVYDEVLTKTLTNDQVTRENVIGLQSFLEKADINDHVMIFLAGHGVLSAELDYYLATYDMDFAAPEKKGLMYEDLEGLLDGIKPLKKTLILDACHSGEIDKEEVELASAENTFKGDVQFRAVGKSVKSKLGSQNTLELTKSLFTDLRKGTGATVISSAGGMEFAMEGDDWNNGLFTYALLNGIKSGEADLNNDNEIWLSELKEYVGQQVTQLSNGKQQPTSRIENQTVDFRLW
tara:strand:- start:3260 stop:5962 length:2703 start_codon:yes stop_codon:yes gene_type:complete